MLYNQMSWASFELQVSSNFVKPREDLIEIGILVVGREWKSQFEFYVHEKLALKAGVSEEAGLKSFCSYMVGSQEQLGTRTMKEIRPLARGSLRMRLQTDSSECVGVGADLFHALAAKSA